MGSVALIRVAGVLYIIVGQVQEFYLNTRYIHSTTQGIPIHVQLDIYTTFNINNTHKKILCFKGQA